MENSLKRLGVSKKVTVNELEAGVPPIFLVFRIQRGTGKNAKEIKKKSLNNEPWFVANGCMFLGMKCEVKHVGLLRKIIAQFMTNHSKDVLGAKAVYVTFKKRKMSQVEINILQRQKRIHCKYMKNITLQELKGIENLSSNQSSGTRMEAARTASSRPFYVS
jgi:hypothetical protein